MMKETGNNLIKTSNNFPTAEEMAKAGVHLGHRTTKWNPKMEPYIFAEKNAVHIINLEKTSEKLEKAMEFLKGVTAKGGKILLVGTSPAAKAVVIEAAALTDMPNVSDRWLGGTMTNFKIMNKRLEYFRELERKRDAGELKKYTKKEQHDFDEEIKKLQKKFGGIKLLMKLPDTLLVLDPRKNDLAIKEAKIAKVPIVTICDTNFIMDPKEINFPIPANDDAISSVALIASYAVKAINDGKKLIKTE